MGQQPQSDLAASVGRAAGRLTSDKALRKRLVRAGLSGFATAAGSVNRVLGKLWHEVTGFLFICLALIGGAEVWRKWNTHETPKLAAAAAFSVLFLYFGVSSFWWAKKPVQRASKRRGEKPRP